MINVSLVQRDDIYLIKGLKLVLLLESMIKNCMKFVVILKE